MVFLMVLVNIVRVATTGTTQWGGIKVKLVSRTLWLILMIVFLCSHTVVAFTQNDFDCTINTTCFYKECGSNTSAAEANSGAPGSAYLLGDSIATDDFAGKAYKKAFGDGQWALSISALSGRHISYGDNNGVTQIDKDKDTISSSSAVIVALMVPTTSEMDLLIKQGLRSY
jgi:hypothetical protein